jgi:hypothetical protein
MEGGKMSGKKFAAISIVLALAVSAAFASTLQQSQQDQQKAMDAYMKMAATNENHAYLAKFAGEWNISTTAWMQPGAPPQTSKGSSQSEMILGGRFLKMHFKGTMFGQPFEGLQIVGYDNMKKKITSFWIDSTSTAFFLTEGSIDMATKTTTETGVWPDPMGGTMGVKGITKMVTPDEYTYEMYMIGPDGKEFKSMEYHAIRKK